MRIKFIKVEEGLETRGKKATGKVSRAVTGHVVTPSGGKVGVDDNPAKPTKKLKAMVRRSYKAKAENSSTEVLGNKIVEGFNDLLEVTAKGVAAAALGQARRGGGSVERGHLPDTNFITVKRRGGNTHVLAGKGGKGGTYVSKKTRSGKSKIRSIPEATAKGVMDAAKNKKGSFTKTSYNPRAHDNDETTYVPGKRSSTTVAKVKGGAIVGREGPKGYRTRKVSDSTQILGNKIVEGFDSLLSELSTKTLKSYQGKAIAQMRQGKKSGLSGAKMAKRGKMIHKAGEKIKAQSGDQKPGQFKRSEEEKLTGKTKKVAEARGDTLAARFEKKSGKPFPEDLNVPKRGEKAGPRIKAAVRIAKDK